MPKKIEYVEGQKVGNLSFVKEISRLKSQRRAEFKCECGQSVFIPICHAVRGATKRCPECYAKVIKSILVKRNTTHGLRRHPLYGVYNGMKQRCSDPNHIGYHLYGGRGIKVCDRWLGSEGFINFLSDMGPKPSAKHTIERKLVNENYGPENCIWLLAELQAINRRNTHHITFLGETLMLKEWAKRIGVDHRQLRWRIFKAKMPLMMAMTKQKWSRRSPHGPVPEIRHTFGFIG